MSANQKRILIFWDNDTLTIIGGRSKINEPPTTNILEKIHDSSNEEIVELIHQHTKNLITQKNELVLVIPRALATMKFLELPSSGKHDLPRMIEFQLPKVVPYPKSEIVYDYKELPSENDTIIKIRLVYFHRKTLFRYLNVLHKAHVQPAHVVLSSEFFPQYMLDQNIPLKGKTLILDLNHKHTTLIVLDEENIIFSRTLSHGIESIDRDDYFSEIDTTLALANLSSPLSELNVYSTGVDADQNNIIEKLNTHFNQDIKIIKTNEGSTLHTDLHSILSSSHLHEALNFIPEDIRKGYQRQLRKQGLRISALYAGILLVLLSAISFTEIHTRKQYLKHTHNEIRLIENKAKSLDLKQKKILTINNFTEKRSLSVSTISKIFKIIPNNIYLKSIRYNPNRIVLRGYAPNLAQAFKFTSSLEKLNLFSTVKTHFARQVKAQNKNLAEFHLECFMQRTRDKS